MAKQTTTQTSASRVLWEPLETLVRQHVQHLIQALLAEAVTTRRQRLPSARRTRVDAPGGSRKGQGTPRRAAMSVGTLTVRRPRGRGLGERVVSQGLPRCKRRTREVGELLPPLSLHGLALGDFALARRGLLGAAAPLSPASVARLRASWQLESEAWQRRRLDDLAVVDVWADGLDVTAGLAETTAAFRVMLGALSTGQKVVLAVESGQRASQASWGAVLRDRRARGRQPWRCPMADGPLGIWAARAAPPPTAAEQRCWNHRLTKVLDAIPQKSQAAARTVRCALPSADTQAACEVRRAPCAKRYRPLAPKAVERLGDDGERLVTFYQCPREHWRHRRPTHVVESPCAAVRLRTTAAQRVKQVEAATAMMWKVLRVAETAFRRLKAPELLPGVYAGVKDVDGLKQRVSNHQEVAA
jgi:putative transposase